MNKRQRKKLNCPKCGNRILQFAVRHKYYNICKVCYVEERNTMYEIMKELYNINPLGVFMNIGREFM